MPMPTVTSFEPSAYLGKDGSGTNILGLNKTANSESDAIITGTNLENQMTVTVTQGTITWSGTLTVDTGSTERGSVALTCSVSQARGRLGDPEDVSVTVGSGLSVSPVKDFTVNVGTPPS